MNELHATALESVPQGYELTGLQNPFAPLETLDGVRREIRASGHPDDGPVKQTTGGAGLFGLEDHL
ncbi:MAG: hypothetical protein JO051_11225 [Acidobacteriaceae bacterium]|nr:hypothetical protein [Acidobacteriaceae bacterium]